MAKEFRPDGLRVGECVTSLTGSQCGRARSARAGTGGSAQRREERTNERMRALSGTGAHEKANLAPMIPWPTCQHGFCGCATIQWNTMQSRHPTLRQKRPGPILTSSYARWLLHRARSRAMETQTWAVDSEGMKGQTKDKESVYLLVGCRERPGPRSVPFKGGRRENSANYIVQGP
jgi:hypothetical protein